MKFNVKKYFQVLGLCIGCIVVAFFVAMGFDFTGKGTIAESDGTVRAESNGTVNVLAMCTDIDGLRTDAMMLISYNTETNQVNMLSIPRDMRMYIGNRYQKINAAHAYETNGEIGGATAACEAVTRITGVPINYYIDFTFDAVAHVINELGTINFTVPDIYDDGVGMVYDDPVQGLHINLPPGNYDLDGSQAVQLLRYRKGNVDPETGTYKSYKNGDADRIKVQQDFLKALVDQKLNLALIKKIPAIFTDVKNEIKTNLTVKDVLKYSTCLIDFTSAGINSQTIPGESVDESSNGSVLVPNMTELQALVQEMFAVTGEDMWYAKPDTEPRLYSDGYYTFGGYVRTTDIDELSDLKASELTNDELLILKGLEDVQYDDDYYYDDEYDSSTGRDYYEEEYDTYKTSNEGIDEPDGYVNDDE